MLAERIWRALAWNLLRAIQWCRVAYYRRLSTAKMYGTAVVNQPVIFLGKGEVHFGVGVTFGLFSSPFYLTGYSYVEARNPWASVRIGSETQINNNFVAVAEHGQITIGDRALIGTNVEIYDSDFHGLRIEDRKVSDRTKAADVVIGNDVFLGSNVKILKGVHIGDGSIVAHGSVVLKSVPPGVIAGGNPARAIRSI